MRNGTKLAKHFSMSDHLLKFGVLYLLVLLIAVASMMSRQFLTAPSMYCGRSVPSLFWLWERGS